MLTDERRAEIERAMQELDDARDAWLKGESRAAPILIGASRALEMACELLAENDQLRHSIDRLKRPIDSYACQRCGRATGLDVVLTDEKWVAISAAAGNLNLLCLWCVDEIAESLGIKASVSLFFAGRAIHGTSQSEADEEHINRLCEREERAEAEVRQLKESAASRSELAATTIAGLEHDAMTDGSILWNPNGKFMALIGWSSLNSKGEFDPIPCWCECDTREQAVAAVRKAAGLDDQDLSQPESL
jgi:hypothetical protein